MLVISTFNYCMRVNKVVKAMVTKINVIGKWVVIGFYIFSRPHRNRKSHGINETSDEKVDGIYFLIKPFSTIGHFSLIW